MERYFEKQVCLGSGIAFLILLFMISLPNGFVLFVLLKNPLRFPRRSFTVFLAFICATDLFVGLVVSSGEALTRFLCAFGDRGLPQEGGVMRVLSYIGVNSSILLVTAMSIDRFIAVVFPHTYRQKWKPKTVVVVNLCIVIFSSIFASIQLSDISLHLYLAIDLHLHTTFPLCTTSMAYLGIFFFLKRQSRIVFKKQTTVPMDSLENDRRQEREEKMERNIFTTSFLIVLFLILSLIPYFVITIVEIRCESCSGQDWFLALKESSIVFLHLNSVFNPFLSSFRISELKRSCAIVLGLQRQVNDTSPNWNRFLCTLSGATGPFWRTRHGNSGCCLCCSKLVKSSDETKRLWETRSADMSCSQETPPTLASIHKNCELFVLVYICTVLLGNRLMWWRLIAPPAFPIIDVGWDSSAFLPRQNRPRPTPACGRIIWEGFWSNARKSWITARSQAICQMAEPSQMTYCEDHLFYFFVVVLFRLLI